MTEQATTEALDALPPDTVMADIDPETSAVNQVVMRVLSGEWAAPGLTQMWSSVGLLAGGDERWTVLFRPDAPTPTPADDNDEPGWLDDPNRDTTTPAGDDQRAVGAFAESLTRFTDVDSPAARSLMRQAFMEGAEWSAARPSAPTVTTEQRALAALTTLVALKDGPRNDTYYAERDAAWQNAREVIASRALGIEVTP